MCVAFIRFHQLPAEDHTRTPKTTGGFGPVTNPSASRGGSAQLNERRRTMPMLPMIEAVLRTHYRLLRVPLAVFEQHLSRPAGQGSAVHSACRQVLITCDRTAAHVLRDGTVGHAADRAEQRHTADRHAHARKQHDRDLRDAAVLDEHRRRFVDSHYRAGHTSPPAHSSETPPKAADGSVEQR